ncbi:hypothetical protein LCGC14_1650460 [marine sediment metagenome]|uniref:Uncharacterized protein n=1 Tax=marine sediment metagenome TaxID=412755 RepID=A0A0F9HWY6_9ZZZZ
MQSKRELLKILKSSGYDDKFISWLRKRRTARELKSIIENDKALIIIERLAKEAGSRGL